MIPFIRCKIPEKSAEAGIKKSQDEQARHAACEKYDTGYRPKVHASGSASENITGFYCEASHEESINQQ